MKALFLFCTKMRYFWGEIPILCIFIFALRVNGISDKPLKLYPLIIFCAFVMIFIVIYFFRVIKISFSEVRYIGRFSSRESAVINAGKTVILRIRKRGLIDVELFGNNGKPPLFCEDEENYEPVDINLFRGRAVGGKRTVKRILKFFGADIEQADRTVAEESSFECENVNISSQKIGKFHEVHIFMKNTI